MNWSSEFWSLLMALGAPILLEQFVKVPICWCSSSLIPRGLLCVLSPAGAGHTNLGHHLRADTAANLIFKPGILQEAFLFVWMLSLQELWDLEIDIGLFILCPQFGRHNFKNITDKYKIWEKLWLCLTFAFRSLIPDPVCKSIPYEDFDALMTPSMMGLWYPVTRTARVVNRIRWELESLTLYLG